MNFNKSLYLTLFLLYFYYIPIFATHIVGGELSYKCLGNNRYEISLTVFRDCDTGVPPFDNPASIGIFDGLTNALLGDIRLLVNNDDTLSETLLDPCFVIPPNVCIHGTVYRDTITLPYNPNGYILSYQRCCRNQDIMNIVEPLETGATYMIHITAEALNSCNSSPSFNAWPPLYLCKNQPFSFDHSAVDIDGDSLVYEICSPFDGATTFNPMPQPPLPPPYDSIRWLTNAGYNVNNMMGGNNPLTVHPQTGLLNVTPPNLGVFVVGVRVKEYRDGVLMSIVQRDFQYIVGDCGRRNNAAFFLPSIICSNDLAVQFNNQSNSDIGLYHWDFGVLNSTTDTSSQQHPIFVYPAPGIYTVRLVAAPNTICTDSFSQTIDVRYNNINANFNYRIDEECTAQVNVYFTDSSTAYLDQIVAWEWDFGDGGQSTAQHPTHTYTRTGNYTINLTVTAANGCKASFTRNFEIVLPPVQDFNNLYFCPSVQSLALNPNFHPNITYNWSPAMYLSDPTASNPTMTIDAQFGGIVYNIDMSTTNTNGLVCAARGQLAVNIAPRTTIELQSTPQVCLTDGTVQIIGNTPNQAVWAWDSAFTNILATGTSTNFNILGSSMTLYVSALDQYNCPIRDSILVHNESISITPVLHYELEQCGLRVLLQDQTPGNITSRRWTISTTSGIVRYTSTDAVSYFTPLNNRETLTIKLEVTTADGCTESTLSSFVTNVPRLLSADTIYKCPGSGAVLNTSYLSNQIYSWSPSTYLDNTNVSNPFTNTPVDMTYYVTITNISASGITCQLLDTVHVVVSPPLTVNVPPYTYSCGNTAIVEAQATGGRGNLTYTWYANNASGTYLGSGNPLRRANTAVGSTFYLEVRDAIGCTATATVSSTATPPPAIIPQFDFEVIGCQGEVQLQLIDRSPYTDIVSWQWISSFEPIRIEQNPIYNVPSSGQYAFSVSITLANGCGGTATQNITLNVPRIANSVRNLTLCESQINTNVLLNGTASGNLTYEWEPHPDLSATNIASPIATISQIPITYYVTITSQSNGMVCQNRDSITIDKGLPVEVKMEYDTINICNTNYVEVYASSQNAYTFTWSTSPTFSPILSTLPNSVLLNLNGASSSFVLYTRVRDRRGCTAIDSVVINPHRYTINTNINHTLDNCDNPIQISFNAQTSSTSNAPITSYVWQLGNNTTSTNATPSAYYDPNINNNSGSYNIILTVRDANNCQSTAIKTINFNIPNLTTEEVSCSNTPNIILNPNNPDNNLSYTWAPHPTFTGNDLHASAQAAIISDTAHYRVTISSNNSGNGCTTVKDLYVGYQDFPYQIQRDTALCATAIDLAVQGDNNWRYTWSLDANFSRILGHTNPFSANVHTNTTYYVRIENSLGCYKVDSIRVRKSNSGIIPNFDVEVLDCSNTLGIQFQDLSQSAQSAIQNWTWTFGDGNITNAISPFHNYTTAGQYPVTLQITNAEGCSESISKILNIELLDTLTTHYSSRICNGESLMLNPNASININYLWDNSQMGLSDYTLPSPMAQPRTSTTYTAIAMQTLSLINNIIDTCQITVTHHVDVDSIYLSLPDIRIGCMGENAYIISANGSSNIDTYTWSPSDLILSGQGSAQVTLNTLQGGENISVVASTALGCTASAQSTVNVTNQGLNVQLWAERDTVRQGDTIRLVAEVINANNNLQYSWSTNIVAAQGENAIGVADFGNRDAMLYTVTVSDNGLCFSVDSVYVFAALSLCQEPYIFVPNTFTPNGDGLNDLLYVRGYNLTDFHFVIYDRWGELVFESHDQNIPWDGTFKGKYLSPDVYGYYLECRCLDGQLFQKKGNVTILK